MEIIVNVGKNEKTKGGTLEIKCNEQPPLSYLQEICNIWNLVTPIITTE